MATTDRDTMKVFHRYHDAIEIMCGAEDQRWRLATAWTRSLSLVNMADVPWSLQKRARSLDSALRTLALEGNPEREGKVLTPEEIDRAAFELFHIYDELFPEVYDRKPGI
jgi:hypothetical protein